MFDVTTHTCVECKKQFLGGSKAQRCAPCRKIREIDKYKKRFK